MDLEYDAFQGKRGVTARRERSLRDAHHPHEPGADGNGNRFGVSHDIDRSTGGLDTTD